jgi:hypothetical protein
MITSNPISDVADFISPLAMQLYVIAMLILVVGGTILDTLHKKSARYFFENAEKSKANRKRALGGGEKAAIALQTVAVDVLASGNSAMRGAGSPTCSPCTASSSSSSRP